MTHTNQWTNRVAIAALILAGFGLQACGDDDTGATPSDDGGSADNGGNGGSDDGSGGSDDGSGGKQSGGKKDGGGGSDTGGTGGDDGSGGASSDAGADSGSGGDCTGADDCYSCEPKTNEQILNHCTEATCQGYDNSTLTELLPGGKLPDLPQ